MSELFSRRTALAGGIGLASGMGLLASETLARAAGYQEDQNAHAPGGPVASSLAASVGKGAEYSLPPLPTPSMPWSRRLMPRQCVCTMTSTTLRT